MVFGALLTVACGGDPYDPGTLTGTGGSTTGTGGTTSGTSSGEYPSAAEGTLIELPTSEPAPPPTRTDFELVFHDDFDVFDTAIWDKASHTFDENAATFSPSNVNVHDGYLVLRLDDSTGSLLSGEARTKEFYSYGRFEVRARFVGVSGVVSSLFTYYDHWADATLEENWNELDVEFLGKDADSVQFNVIHWNASNQRTTHEQLVSVGFNPSEEFHEYAIEWLPSEVRFYVDDVLVHSQTEAIAEFLTLDQKMMMNTWPVVDSMASWAGLFDTTSLPLEAYYDWARVYRYTGN